MEHYLFNQLAYVRAQVLKVLEGVSEETADRIPDGFRNSIRWQLGHIYVVCERFAFQFVDAPLHMPDGFKPMFENGTSPLDALSSPPSLPGLQELKTLLSEQPERIRHTLGDRMQSPIVPPYTTSGGMTLGSPEQFLSFSLFHEGMHLSVIKLYKILLAE